jgi:hypothetical protein
MSIDSGPESLLKKNKRIAKRNSEADISPDLREHITLSAQKIRVAHKAELADVLKADRAGRLFRSLIRPNRKPVGSLDETSGGAGDGVATLAGELGGLLNDAIRAGTGLLEGPMAILAQAWMATEDGRAVQPNLGMASVAGPVPGTTSQPQPSAASQTLNTTVDTAIPGGHVPAMPAPSPEELELRSIFRRSMPMLLAALSQGGDGYGLAETVITLFGRPRYDQVSGLGKDKIMQLVKAEPDLWAQVAPNEVKFSRFLDEFTGYDAWTEEQERQAKQPPSRRRKKAATE